MFKICLCILLTVSVVDLSILPSSNKNNEDQNKYCDYDGLKIKIGQTVSLPGKCVLATCHRDTISALTCSEFQAAPGCHETDYDYEKPYPECCPQSFCD